MATPNPPRHGEGYRSPKANGGGGPPQAKRLQHTPSTMLRMVPLPVPGRILFLDHNPNTPGFIRPSGSTAAFTASSTAQAPASLRAFTG
ncbi:MAG: hypothetical protein B7Y47_01025 [Sphingomonas sp. 28-63-12]|nr:MAG: hypothetical protein B7Y47_01025 [Sphingomonas sp. 28-63-12]